MKKESFTCEQCGAPFLRYLSQVMNPRFCSRLCKSKNRTKEGMRAIACEICGQVFKRNKARIGLHNYCSTQCARIASKQRQVNTLERVRSSQTECTCKQCGKIFYSARRNIKHCSRDCVFISFSNTRKIPNTDPQQCTSCLLLKPLAEHFYKLKQGNYSLRCKQCWSQPSYETKRRSHLRVKFGISLEDWIVIYKSQDGTCAICLKMLPSIEQMMEPRTKRDSWSNRDWNTDHCHSSGKIRGILCRGCNQGLGAFRDNTEALRRAAEYVERSKAKNIP